MKSKMKRVIGLGTTIALIATMTACGNDSEVNTAEHETYEKDLNKVEEINVPEESTEKVNTGSYESEVTATNDMEEYHKQILTESMYNTSLVEFHKDSKSYLIIPFDDELINFIGNYAEYGIGYEEWNQIVANLIETSEMMMNDMGAGYSIKMINPADFSRTLINIKDGEVITRI